MRRGGSTAPGPGVVPVSDDECRGMGTHFRLDVERARAGVLSQANGADERIGQLVDGGRVAERFGEGGGGGDRRLRFSRQLGETGLIVGDEDGAVLEKRTLRPPLRAPGEFASVDRELAGARLVEAGSQIGNRRATGRRERGGADADGSKAWSSRPLMRT